MRSRFKQSRFKPNNTSVLKVFRKCDGRLWFNELCNLIKEKHGRVWCVSRASTTM